MDEEEFLAAFGISRDPDPDPNSDPDPNLDPDPGADPDPDPNKPQDPGANTPPDGKQGDPEPDPEPDPAKTQPQPDTRMNEAFAQMRIQNKNQAKLLQGIAQVLKVDAKDPDALQTALQQMVLNAQAKQQKVDPAVLERLQTLEEQNEAFTQDQIQRNAFQGFQQLKTKFGLDDAALDAFADQLVAEGNNPFVKPMNLVTAYIERHGETLIADAETRGAQREAERAAKAAKHSTTPNDKNGQTTGDPEKITSVRQLNDWFEKNGAGK